MLLFIDTETTDLLKPDAANLNLQPHITEIYCVKLTDDLEFVEEFDTFVKPPVPIPQFITQKTGISDETVAGAPPFALVYDELAKFFLGQDAAIGHNISFDLGVIYCELARLNLEFHFPWPKRWICTVEKSMPIEHHRLTLSKLHALATGNPHEGAHRARGDVIALVACYKWLREQMLV